MNLESYITVQRDWSRIVFGQGKRTEGICKHIEKELSEIRAAPLDVEEWCDVIILALDGAWRAGHSPEDVTAALHAKQMKNFRREWPTPISENEPTEHSRRRGEERCDEKSAKAPYKKDEAGSG
jgi:hypothetical protein